MALRGLVDKIANKHPSLTLKAKVKVPPTEVMHERWVKTVVSHLPDFDVADMPP